jgi:hypothetical protein
MIRAVYRDGKIEPLDKIPAYWDEGQELEIQQTGGKMSPEEFDELDQWVAEMEEATKNITDEDHDQFMAILNQLEAESKEQGRREMEKMSGRPLA